MTHSSRCPYLCIQGLGPFLKSPCLWSLCILTKLLRIISGPSRWVFHLPPPSSKCSHNSLGFHCPTQASPTHRTRPCPLLVTWGKSLMHRCLTPLIYDSSLRPAAPKDEIFLFHHSTLSTHITWRSCGAQVLYLCQRPWVSTWLCLARHLATQAPVLGLK